MGSGSWWRKAPALPSSPIIQVDLPGRHSVHSGGVLAKLSSRHPWQLTVVLPSFFSLTSSLLLPGIIQPMKYLYTTACLRLCFFFFFWRGKWWWWWSAGETQAKQTPWSVMQCWEATDETCTRQHGWMGKAECRVGGGEEEGANKIFKAAQSTYVKNARTQITGHFA